MDDSEEDLNNNSFSQIRHKIVFVGEAGVGKISIINRIVDNGLEDAYELSKGVDFKSKIINYHGQNIKFQLWDTPGQEKYKALIPSYVRKSSIVLVVYDISQKTSFDKVPFWINYIKSIENTKIVLCGNKTDLSLREVEKSEAEQFAQKERISFFEICAKTNENVKLMSFSIIADLPIFSEAKNKEEIIKQLLEEDRVENIQEENKLQNQNEGKGNTIIVKGKTTSIGKKKFECLIKYYMI